MSTYKNLMTVCCVAALALGLAACGGGGSSTPQDQTQTTPDPAVVAAEAAIAAANMAAGMLDSESDDADVTAAEGLITAAETAIAALPEGARAAHTAMLAAAKDQAATQRARLTAQAAADDEEAKRKAAEMALEEERKRQEEEAAKAAAAKKTADGKALKAALGSTPLANLTEDAPTGTTQPSLTPRGLTVGIPAGPADNPPPAAASPRMKPGASAGSLNGWAGTNYAHTNAGTKVSNSAIVYNNRAAPKSYPIASRYAVTANVPTNAGTYTPADRMLSLGEAADTNIKADMFPSAGETTYTPTAPSDENLVRGTYQGAAGTYRCTGTCTAEATPNGIMLSTAWVFVHDTGAMVSIMDPSYLYFGWWLTKDKDGKPTSASAFTGVGGTAIAPLEDSPLTLTGSATYTGAAAGKFAISDPLRGGDAGHFTADATLTAKFGAAATADTNNANGLSGTLDNFMANGESVPWSVSLLRANLTATGGTAPFNDPDTNPLDESERMTVWSIDGNAATASGTWSAQMYDEKPGPMPRGDGSNVPTSVIGKFHSEFGSTHTMVGAFGATKD